MFGINTKDSTFIECQTSACLSRDEGSVSAFARISHRTSLFAIVVVRSAKTPGPKRNLLIDKEVSVYSDQEDLSFESSKNLSLTLFTGNTSKRAFAPSDSMLLPRRSRVVSVCDGSKQLMIDR